MNQFFDPYADLQRQLDQMRAQTVPQMQPQGFSAGEKTNIIWAQGIEGAKGTKIQNGASVINMSYGGPGDDPYGDEAIALALQNGATPVAAAGNEALYGRLALIDMLRGGRIRERRFAEKKIGEML